MNTEAIKTYNNSRNPETWMELYGEQLYRFALSKVKDSVEAEDIVQETFLAAIKGYKNFKGRSAILTWLIAILKYKSVDHIRKKQREREINDVEHFAYSTEEKAGMQGAWPIPFSRMQGTPMQFYARKEFMKAVYKCLSGIPERPARVFIMREIEGLNTQQICEAMNVTPANCLAMIYRARQRLRGCVDSCWFE